MSITSPSIESETATTQGSTSPPVPVNGWRRVDPAASQQRLEDRDLVRSILDGENGAFDRLHDLYAERIYRFAVSRLRDPVEAEDVVQDTFLEVHRCLEAWEGRSRLLTWMFGIAHHQMCRRFRKKRPVGMPIENLEATLPDGSSVPGEERLDAVRALEVCASVLDAEVSLGQREIFDLYYGECRPMKQIANALGKSSQAVKISLFRTRKAMSARLDELELRQIA